MNDSLGKPGPAADVDPLTVFDPAKREADLRAMTRIVLQPIGSPMPLGFFTVAIDSVLVSALQWGPLPTAGRQAVALIVYVNPAGVRLSADKLLVHPALDEHYGASSELETAACLAHVAKRAG
jgi:hypothetical protein